MQVPKGANLNLFGNRAYISLYSDAQRKILPHMKMLNATRREVRNGESYSRYFTNTTSFCASL